MGDEARTFPASDGYAFAVRVYRTPSAPLGRIVFLHGIRSHGGWYTRSCEQFAAAGYEVHFLDRRGAGLNTVARGDTPNFRRLLDDVTEYLTAIRTPGVPTTLAGISWGGKPALAVAARAPRLVDAVVLFCPGLVPLVGVPPPVKLRIAFARLVNPTKMYPIPLNEPDLFTASPEWQRHIAADPHGLTRATARFLFGSARLDLYLKRVAKRVTAPVLCLLAEHDRVIHNGKTREYLKRLSRVDVTEYPGAHHTLEFEPAPTFVADVTAWLRRTISA